MATLNLWVDFTKRKNSTKQPPETPTYYKDVKLKEATSIENPVFIVDGIQADTNYCQYAGHYYYIDDVVYVTNTVVEIHCTKDLLATYKSAIQSSSALVLYYSHNNQEIVDARLSTKTTASYDGATANFDSLGATPATNSAIIVGVTGQDSIGNFAMSQNTLKGLLSQAIEDTWQSSIDTIEQEYPYTFEASLEDWVHNIMASLGRQWEYLKVMFQSADYKGFLMDSIKYAIQLPISVSDCGGTPTSIKLGAIDTGVNGNLVGDRIFSDGCDVTIPWQASDWRRNAPYHEIYLYIPWVGVVNISPSEIMGETTLHVAVSLDKFTGNAIFTVKAGSKCVHYSSTNIGSSYPIGSSNISPLASATSIVGGAASLLTGNALGVAMATIGLANTIEPMPTCIGSNSGGAGLGLNGNSVYCWTVFHDTTVAPANINAELGTPANQVMSLSAITGYVQTANASVNMAGHGTDKDDINNLLNGGVYIE